MTARLEHIDFYRGVAMTFVIAMHCWIFWEELLVFHMPLFFFLNGYTAYLLGSSADISKIGNVIKKRFLRLMIPYFLFDIIHFALSWIAIFVIGNSHSPIELKLSTTDAILSSVTALPRDEYRGVAGCLWFFPAMFMSSVLAYIIRGTLKGNRKYTLMAIIVCFFLSWIISCISIERLPFTLDISIMATAFILLGWYIAPWLSTCCRAAWWKQLIVLCICISGVIWSKENNTDVVRMYNDTYGNYLIAIPGAFCGITASIIAASALYNFLKFSVLQHVVKYISTIGIYSLLLYPIHLDFLSILSITPLPNNIWLRFVCAMVFCLPIAILADKIFPPLSGRFKWGKTK